MGTRTKVLAGEIPPEFNGSGYGYGYGYGYGDGDGYGYGSGSGYGYGSGSGDGYGYGYGSKEYWEGLLEHFASQWSASDKLRLANLQKAKHTIAFWRSDINGKPCNGGEGEAVYPGLVQTVEGPLQLCTIHALHGTSFPPNWKGERIWIVALKGEVVWEGDKCGALCREIIGECL